MEGKLEMGYNLVEYEMGFIKYQNGSRRRSNGARNRNVAGGRATVARVTREREPAAGNTNDSCAPRRVCLQKAQFISCCSRISQQWNLDGNFSLGLSRSSDGRAVKAAA